MNGINLIIHFGTRHAEPTAKLTQRSTAITASMAWMTFKAAWRVLFGMPLAMGRCWFRVTNKDQMSYGPVSYTHLTLPTITGV